MSLQLRPWSEFFESNRFQKPEIDRPQFQKLQQRLTINFLYYQANYLAILALCFLYVCIARPLSLLGIILTLGLYVYLFKFSKVINHNVQLEGLKINVPKRKVQLLFFCVSCFLLLLLGQSPAIAALFLSATCITLHSLFRIPSLKARGSTFMEMWRGASPLAQTTKDQDDVDEEAGVDAEQDAIKKEQQQQRSAWRANMRAKYGKN